MADHLFPAPLLQAFVVARQFAGAGDQPAAIGAGGTCRTDLPLSVVEQGRILRIGQPQTLYAMVWWDGLLDLGDQRRIASTMVQQREPQCHEQQPAQCGPCGRQDQTFPEFNAVTCGAPSDQGQPGQHPQACNEHRPDRQAVDEFWGSTRHIAGGHCGRACLHGDPDHPDDQCADREKQQSEPVDEGPHAASQGWQGKCCQRGNGGQGRQKRPVRKPREPGGAHRDEHKPQGQADVRNAPCLEQLAAPTPQGPECQRACGPGEPEQQASERVQIQHGLCHQSPAPQVQRTRQRD